MRKLFLFGLLATIITISLVGCSGSGGAIGDTLEEDDRERMFSILAGDSDTMDLDWQNTYSVYTEIFGMGTGMPESFLPPDQTVIQIESFIRRTAGIKKTEGASDILWSGPDAGGWYTYTFNIIDSENNMSCVLEFRYFSASHRVEFRGSTTNLDIGAVTYTNGYYVFNSDPLGSDPVYPKSLSIYVYLKETDIEFGTKLTGTGLELVSLPELDSAILVGKIKLYMTMDIAGLISMRDYLVYDITTSVIDADSSTPILHVEGIGDIDEDPGYDAFSEDFDLTLFL